MLSFFAAIALLAAAPDAGSRARLVPEPDVLGVVLADGRRVHPGRWWDPYGPNVLKGDRPILGTRGYVVLTGVVDSLYSADQPSSGADLQQRSNNTVAVALEAFSGQTVFRPKTFSIKAVGFARTIVDPDGNAESVDDFSFGETFLEILLAEHGRRFYDSTSLRGGAQAVNLDVLGLVLADVVLGARGFSERHANRHQVNVLWARPLRKDAQSALNDATALEADVGAFSWTLNDAFPGFDVTGLVAVADDRRVEDRTMRVGWGALASAGHVGRFTTQSALYLAAGQDDGATTGKSILAPMAVVDLARPAGAWNPRVTLLWAPGDADPTDESATAYDAFADKVAFAGGGGAGVLAGNGRKIGNAFLFRKGSVLPSLRGANDRPNFVHGGVQLADAGLDVAVTPRFALSLDAVAYFWDRPGTLGKIAGVDGLESQAAQEYIGQVRVRPFLNENVVVTASAAALVPGPGLTGLGVDPDTEVRGDARILLVF